MRKLKKQDKQIEKQGDMKQEVIELREKLKTWRLNYKSYGDYI